MGNDYKYKEGITMARQDQTFAAFLENNYYDEIFYRLKGYVFENRNKLKLHTVSITHPSYVALDEFRIMGVTFKESDDNTVSFYVAVQASLVVKGRTPRGFEEGKTKAWFTLNCSGILCDGFSQFTILAIDEYTQAKFYQEDATSKFLVPYIHVKDLDHHAENFLKKYCPCALGTPMPLPIEDVLKAMGLTKYPARLPEGIFGRIHFGKEKADIINGENISTVEVDAGTILVNPNSFFMGDIGCKNNTIIHECVHWEKHRKFFELQRLINPERTSMSCQTAGEYKEENDELLAELEWIEWQANALAPKILIPASTGRTKLTEILDELTTSQPATRKACIMEQAISQFADFFKVSTIAAKIRAIEFGFEQAAGVWNYVDGQRCSPFSFKNGALEKNQTFVIDQNSFITETARNKELRTQIASERFIYAGGMLVANTPQYVRIQNGCEAQLTEYALEHVDECCLVFNRDVHVNKHYDNSFYETCYLCRPVDSTSFIEATIDPNDGSNKKMAEHSDGMTAIMEEAKRICKIQDGLPSSFCGSLDCHIKRRGYTNYTLETLTNISSRMIQDYRHKRDKKPALPSILALCIGLNLHPSFSFDLIEKAGYNIFTHTEENYIYRYLINNHHMEDIDMWNQRLLEAGISQQLPKNGKKYWE